MQAGNHERPISQHIRGTVCVIDGDQGVRNSLCILLRTLRVEVLSFPTAEEFLDLIEGVTPSCLITEVSLPGMSGFELIDALHARGIRLPAIGLTLEANAERTGEAERVGLLDLVEKPFVHGTVERRVRETLGLSG